MLATLVSSASSPPSGPQRRNGRRASTSSAADAHKSTPHTVIVASGPSAPAVNAPIRPPSSPPTLDPIVNTGTSRLLVSVSK